MIEICFVDKKKLIEAAQDQARRLVRAIMNETVFSTGHNLVDQYNTVTQIYDFYDFRLDPVDTDAFFQVTACYINSSSSSSSSSRIIICSI